MKSLKVRENLCIHVVIQILKFGLWSGRKVQLLAGHEIIPFVFASLEI
jgi:hypothetical protein